MLTNFVYHIQPKNRKNTGPNQCFFCFMNDNQCLADVEARLEYFAQDSKNLCIERRKDY